MNDADFIERMAAHQDGKAIDARRIGLFCVADRFAQFAEWLRCRMPVLKTHGDNFDSGVVYAEHSSIEGEARIFATCSLESDKAASRLFTYASDSMLKGSDQE